MRLLAQEFLLRDVLYSQPALLLLNGLDDQLPSEGPASGVCGCSCMPCVHCCIAAGVGPAGSTMRCQRPGCVLGLQSLQPFQTECADISVCLAKSRVRKAAGRRGDTASSSNPTSCAAISASSSPSGKVSHSSIPASNYVCPSGQRGGSGTSKRPTSHCNSFSFVLLNLQPIHSKCACAAGQQYVCPQ